MSQQVQIPADEERRRQIHRAVASLRSGSQRRYPAELRAQIAAYARERLGRGISRGQICEELGVSDPTLVRLAGEDPAGGDAAVPSCAGEGALAGERERCDSDTGPGRPCHRGARCRGCCGSGSGAVMMLGPTGRPRVFAYGAPCDMRKSFNTLSGLVTSMGHVLAAGDVFLFVGAHRKRAKVLWFDGTGLCLLAKRLSKGHFARLWNETGESPALTMSELRLFLEGCELVGRVPLSPPPLDVDRASRVTSTDFC